MTSVWCRGNAARRGALHLQAASCKLCERSRQGRAAVVASASSSGGGSSFQEPWKRFTTSTVISKSTLNRLKVAELREVLQERGLSTDGLKMDLVERMHAVLHEQGGFSGLTERNCITYAYHITCRFYERVYWLFHGQG